MQFANLAEYKEKRGFSGREMARKLAISEPHLSLILSGKRSMSKKLAKRISKKTGIPLISLLYPRRVS
jgi:transcriptional regulator with XRE-family HTH domain